MLSMLQGAKSRGQRATPTIRFLSGRIESGDVLIVIR